MKFELTTFFLINPYAAGGQFAEIQNETKNLKNWLKPWQVGTHLNVLRESYPMNTNKRGFRCCSKIFAFLCLGWK